MLPPLRSQPSSSQPVPGQRSDTTMANLVAAVPADMGAVSSGLDLNSALIGQLNLLLLTTDERLAQHFSVLTDVFGRSLGLARGDEETAYDFARRIVKALETLSPERLALIEKQLNQLFDGLKLQTLMAAFSDPRGSAAAAMAALIETHSTGSDAAARTVLTLYRQYEIDDGSRAVKSQGLRPLQAATDAGYPAGNAAGRQDAAAIGSRVGTTPLAMASDASPAAFRPLAASNANTVSAFSPSAGASPSTENAQNAAGTGTPVGQPGRFGLSGMPMEGAAAAKAPLPNLTEQQGLLQKAYATAGAASSALLRPEALSAQAGTTQAGTTGAIPLSPTAQPPKPEDVASAIKAAASADALANIRQIESLYTALVWREPTTSQGSLLLRPPEGDSVAKLLTNALFGSPTAKTAAGERQPPTSGISSSGTGSTAAAAQGQQQHEQTTQPQPATTLAKEGEIAASANRGKAEPSALLTASVPGSDLAAALSAQAAAKNAAVPPMVHYLFADDEPDEIVKEESHFFGHGSGGEEAEQNADDDQQTDDQAESDFQDEASMEPGQGVDERAGMAPTDPDMERANDLYWRMGGWS